MGKETFWDKVRGAVAGVAFSMYLWSIRMTADEYWNEMRRQAMSEHFNCKCALTLPSPEGRGGGDI